MAARSRKGPAVGNETRQPSFVTIAVKHDTYSRLSEIKMRYGLKSFDDVVRLLLSNCYDVRLA